MGARANVGVIGGGLMGREVASALGRWFVLDGFPVEARLIAVCDLVEGLGGTVAGLVFVVELEFLPGRKKLEGYDVRSLIKYQS